MIRSLYELLRPYRLRLVFSILLASLTTLAQISLFAVAGYLISASALHPSSVLLLWVPIIGVRFFGISRSVLRYAERLVTHDVTFRFLARQRVWLYELIEPRITRLTGMMGHGVLVNTVTHDIDLLQYIIIRVITPIASSFVTVIAVFLFFAHFSLTIAWTTIALQVVSGVIIPSITHLLGIKPSKRMQETRSRFYAQLEDALVGMKEIRAFGQESTILQKLSCAEDNLIKEHDKIAQIDGFAVASVPLFSQLAMLFTTILATSLVVHGHLTGVYLALLAFVSLSSFEALTGLPQAFLQLGVINTALAQIQAIASTKEDIIDSHETSLVSDHHAHTTSSRCMDTLSVQNVIISYDAALEPAVRNVSFDLPIGKKMAIVGETGSGKSTLLSCLLRLIDYTDGSISLGDQSLRQLSIEDVRRQFSVLTQDSHLFHTTVEDNIRIGNPFALMDEVIDAAQKAHIAKRIAELDLGYESLTGEFGAQLSSGEQRRLALARTLLKDAPILALDEPTRGFDALLEQQFFDTLPSITGGRSLLLITHRLLGMQFMDEILVMQHGRIIERGTHENLLKENGLYARMVRLEQEQLTFYLPKEVASGTLSSW